MNKNKRIELYSRVLKAWGKPGQLIMAIEEMSELIQTLTKRLRGNWNDTQMGEELADVEIMLEQLRVVYPQISSIANRQKEEKLQWLLKNVKETEGHQE